MENDPRTPQPRLEEMANDSRTPEPRLDAMANDPLSAQQQLDALAESRRRFHDQTATPGWYHPALGLMMAAYITLAPYLTGAWTGLLVAGLGAGLVLLIQGYRNATGVWVEGFRAPGAVAFGGSLAVVYLLAVVAANVIRTTGQPGWWQLVPALAVVGVTILIGRAWDRHGVRSRAARQ